MNILLEDATVNDLNNKIRLQIWNLKPHLPPC